MKRLVWILRKKREKGRSTEEILSGCERELNQVVHDIMHVYFVPL